MYIYSWNCGRNGVVWQRSCFNARSSVRLDEVFFSMVLHEVALQAKLFLTQFLCMCEFSFFSFSNTRYICVCLLFLYIYIYILCNLSPTWYSSSINLCYSSCRSLGNTESNFLWSVILALSEFKNYRITV